MQWQSITPVRAAVALAALLGVPAPVPGATPPECIREWRAFDPTTAGLPPSLLSNAPTRAMAFWDPDGAGAAPGVVAFAQGVPSSTHRVITFDPAKQEWGLMPGLMNNNINALTTTADGTLVIGGDFVDTWNGAFLHRIAAWNGRTWTPMGLGMQGGPVDALARTPSGDIIAAGRFVGAGGLPAQRIARWDGSSWSRLGGGLGGTGTPRVNAVAVASNGEVFVGGSFTTAGGEPALNVARWDGQGWSPMGAGLNGSVRALAVLPSGDVVAGGTFLVVGGHAQNLARWDGSQWHAMVEPGHPVSGEVSALVVNQSGQLVALGAFAILTSSGPTQNAALWNGQTWLAMPSTQPLHSFTSAAATPTGQIFAGPGTGATGIPALRWDGVQWSVLRQISDAFLAWLILMPNGDLIAGGGFFSFGGAQTMDIARWDGHAWQPMGDGLNGWPHTMVLAGNGDLIVGGNFTHSGSITLRHIGRWNGSTWAPLGEGSNSPVTAAIVMPNGDIVASGRFGSEPIGMFTNNVARWDGTTWSSMGTLNPGRNVWHFTFAPNGDLIAAGDFSKIGDVEARGVARWNGASWEQIGVGIPGGGVARLAWLPDGSLLAGGRFLASLGAPANFLVRWDGTTWQPFGGELLGTRVSVVRVLANGDVIVGGLLTSAGGVPVNNIARWNGQQWTALSTGANSTVFDIVELPNGDIVVGGHLTAAGHTFMTGIARWACERPACYPNCDGSTATPVLTPADFVCFINRFRMGDLYANCDDSQDTPALTPADFVCFLNKFRAGCP